MPTAHPDAPAGSEAGIDLDRGEIDFVVVGAGQAALYPAHHLLQRGVRRWSSAALDSDGRTLPVLDANAAAVGAWQHRSASLRMATDEQQPAAAPA